MNHVDFMRADAETVDLSRASVVTLFLSPEGNLRLRPRLREQLRNGARVVSNRYDMGDWQPEKTVTVPGPERGNEVFLFRTRGSSRGTE